MRFLQLGRNMLPHRILESRRRRLLQQLLVPPLDAAIALAQNFHVAMLIRQYLKFDMPRRPDVFLEINVGARKCRSCFLLRLRQQTRQLLSRIHHAHAASPTTRRRFQYHRISDPRRRLDGFFRTPQHAIGPGRMGTP